MSTVTEFDEADIARLRAAVMRVSRQLDRQVHAGDLSRTQLEVLAMIARRGPLGASELAELVAINPTMLSRILSKLEDAELVRRRPGEEDRRAVRAEVTAAGRALSEKARAERTRLLAAQVERLSGPDGALLRQALPALESLADLMAARTVRA